MYICAFTFALWFACVVILLFAFLCMFDGYNIISKHIHHFSSCTSPPSSALGQHRPSATNLGCQGAAQSHFTQFHHCGAVAVDRETAVGDEIPLPVQGKHQFLRVGLELFFSPRDVLIFVGPRNELSWFTYRFAGVYHDIQQLCSWMGAQTRL